MNVCVRAVFLDKWIVTRWCCWQAADRRDRLIYVLSQINAARGDDAMHLDEDESSESEDEVRRTFI